MNALIIYATNSGGTYHAAEIVKNTLMANHARVVTIEADKVNPDDINQYDLVVFGSNTWEYKGIEGQLPTPFQAFIDKCNDKTFPDKKFAVFALGDTSYQSFCAATDHLEKLIVQLHGTQIGESLQIDAFYANQTKHETILHDWAIKLSLS